MITILLHFPVDELEPLEDWIRYLPEGMKLFSCYIIAHRMCLQQKYHGAHAVSRIAVEFSSKQYVLPEIHCKLIDAVALINLKRVADAEKQFMAAWNLSRPDNFIEPFIEHYLMLQGIAERCLKTSYPEEYKMIVERASVFLKNFTKLHNSFREESVAEDLTVTEFSIALLYTRGWSAKEISSHLDMSVRTVYRHMSNIYAALGINSVAELKKYMLN